MRVLDLYSGAGGCTKGYQDAGFYVVGVDNRPQPRYCGDRFILGDALEVLAGMIETGEIEEYSLIAASPPCQAYTDLRTLQGKTYPDLISVTRTLLRATGKPYVIENVEGAPLINPILLCGVMFGLKVFRHRLFECSPWILAPGHPKHNGSTGTHRYPYKPINGYIQVTGAGGNFTLEQGQKAMDIDWMNKEELAQAIPPAYTKWVGEQMKEAMKEVAL